MSWSLVKRAIVLSVLGTGCWSAWAQASLWKIPAPACVTGPTDTITIAITGDVMMHTRQLSYPEASFIERIDYSLKAADIAITNMEFTLSGKPYTGYPRFSSPDSYAATIAGNGADIFLTANNHILDYGSAGLMRTLGIYASMRDSVLFTGSGRNREEFDSVNPLIVKKRGTTIAFINFTYGTNSGSDMLWPKVLYMNRKDVGDAIGRAKDAGADFIFALPHWGQEYSLKHNAVQEEWAEWMTGMGVDAIIGSHPHVLQDCDTINGVPVYYSLGNLVSNMSARNTRLGAVAIVKIVHNSEKTEIIGSGLRFTWCTLPGMLSNSYATIFVDDYIGRRNEWITPSDYDNMIDTYTRVIKETGYEEEHSFGVN